jgi:hypothetical protein
MQTKQPETSGHTDLDLWAWLGVFVVLLLVCFVRFRLLDMPLERDEGEYAYAGQLMLQGIPPYQLAWNMKLPGTYFIYALGMAAFGETPAGIHTTLMIVNGLTIIFVYLLVRKLFGPLAGVMACAAFGILSVSPVVLGMAAHANHFVVLFAVLGTLLLRKGEEFHRWYILFFSGMFYGLAFLMKQQGVCFCFFAIFLVILSAILNKEVFSTMFLRKICFLCLGMLLPLVLTYNYLAQAGVIPKFWFWTYSYATTYAAELTPSEGIAKFLNYVEKKWLIYFTFLGFILVSLPFVLRDRAYRNQIVFAIVFLFFSMLGVVIDLNFREHYFILLLPALGMFFGLAIVSLQYATESKFLKAIPLLIGLSILGWSVYQQRLFFFSLPANAVSRIVYMGDAPFTDMPAVGDYIRTHSAPASTVAVVGSEPEIYFYAQRHPATGYIYMYPLMEPQTFATNMQHEMITQIQTNKPEILVYVNNPDSWNVRPTSDTNILKWVAQYTTSNYDEVALVDQISWDKTTFVKDAGMRNYKVVGPDYVAIFKRKPSH